MTTEGQVPAAGGQPPAGEGYLVPDVLQPGLTLVLVGTAPSRISARVVSSLAERSAACLSVAAAPSWRLESRPRRPRLL